MLKKRIHFFSNVLDDYGMPQTFRAYYIISRTAQIGESANITDGRAKVYSISIGAIPLNPEYIIAEGGAENAVDLAIEKLKLLNPDLNFRIFDNE